jgi:hypothetical protein
MSGKRCAVKWFDGLGISPDADWLNSPIQSDRSSDLKSSEAW